MSWRNPPSNVEDYEGFVYLIIDDNNDKRYIGCKRFWKTIKMKPLKGKKRRRIKRVESDWKTYNSSNKEVAVMIEAEPSRFRKIIVDYCSSVTEMKCKEAYYQLKEYLFGDWNKIYNEVINLRVRIRKKGEDND